MTEPLEPTSSPTPPASARVAVDEAAAGLAAMAPAVQAALVALGLLGAAAGLRGVDLHQGAGPALAALGRLGGFVLAGWVARRLLAAVSAVLALLAAGTESAPSGTPSPRGATSGAAPVDPAPGPPGPVAPPAAAEAGIEAGAADPRTRTLAEIRAAMRRQEWAQAGALLETFGDEHPDDPAAARLADELAAGKQAAVAALRDRIDAAREAGDAERILEARAALAPLLAPEALRALDRDLARGFLVLIQKRLRGGVMTVDVAVLAAGVAEALDTTPEGASLRAALPTLRRSVGLCARCGKPYTGIADACPACIATSSFPVYVPPAVPATSNGEPMRPANTAPSEGIAAEPE